MVQVTPANAFGRPGDLARRLQADFLALAQTELQRSGSFDVISTGLTQPQRRPVGTDYSLVIDVVKFMLNVETKNQFIVFNARYKCVPTVTYTCNWKLIRDGFVRAGDRVEGQVVGREFVCAGTTRNGRTGPPTERQVFQYALEQGEWPSSESMRQIVGRITQQLAGTIGTNAP